MSTFRVPVTRIRAIEPIPGADAIELAVVGDYRSVIKKGQFQAGELCAYIPEAALVPQELLREIGLEGKLAGPEKNRIKAIRLRGVLSQGITIPAKPEWTEGQDVATELGITKYVPPIPTHLMGQVFNLGREWTFHYDIENFKAFPDVLHDGECVVMSEKLHGTWTGISLIPNENPILINPDTLQPKTHQLAVSSKGLFAQGLAFKDCPENAQTLYLRVARTQEMEKKIRSVFRTEVETNQPVYVLGETFGAGVQDLKYGASTASDETLGFRVFDIFVGHPAVGRFLDDAELDEACLAMGLLRVPILYRGPFSKAAMLSVTDGKETLSGQALHLREGTVVKPVIERAHNGLPMNRVCLKSVSSDYLTRKGNKGEEPTELE